MNFTVFSVLIKHLPFQNTMGTYQVASFVARNRETVIQYKSTQGYPH